MKAPGRYIISLGYQDSNTLITGSTEGNIDIWNLREKRIVKSMDSHNVTTIACQPNGALFAVNWRRSCVKLIDALNPEIEYTYPYSAIIETLKFSQSGKLIAAGDLDSNVKVWDSMSFQTISTFANHTHSVDSLAFHGDSFLATGGTENPSICIFDLTNKKLLTTLDSHIDRVTAVFFLNETSLLSMGFDSHRSPHVKPKGSIRIWDITSRTCKLSIVTESAIQSGILSPDNGYFFSGCADGTILVGKCDTLKIINAYRAHREIIRSLSLSPDGKTLASTSGTNASSSSIIRFWDAIHLLQGE